MKEKTTEKRVQRRPGGRGLPRERSEARPEALQAKVSTDFRKRLDRLVHQQHITRSQWLYEAARTQLARDELPPVPRDPDGTMRLAHSSSVSMELALRRDSHAPETVAPLALLRLTNLASSHTLSLSLDAEHLRRVAASLETRARELEAFDVHTALQKSP
jgi:hypothetical protein